MLLLDSFVCLEGAHPPGSPQPSTGCGAPH